RHVLAEGRGHEALGADQRLPPLVVGGDEWQVRARYLDVVAEDLVVADFERRDARALALRRLEAREPAPRVPRRLAQLVDFPAAPRPERPAQLEALHQLLYRVEPPADRGGIEQRIDEPLAQPPRAHRRGRLVEHPEERAAPLAAERLQQLEVPARRRVELEKAGRGV